MSFSRWPVMFSCLLAVFPTLLLFPISSVLVAGWVASGPSGYLVSTNMLVNGSVSVVNSTSSQPIDLLQSIVQIQQQLNTLSAQLNTLSAQLPPIGSVVAFAGSLASNSIPSNWLRCDGSVYQISSYPLLYEAIGSAHGSPTPGVTFQVPDYRGWFLRGVDQGTGTDPDATTRSSNASNGMTGDAVGSAQLDTFGAHDHNWQDPLHQHTITESSAWVAERNIPDGVLVWNLAKQNTNPFGTGTYMSTTNIRFELQGGSETRPKNKYVYYLIRAF